MRTLEPYVVLASWPRRFQIVVFRQLTLLYPVFAVIVTVGSLGRSHLFGA